MIYLFASVLCSTILIVILKLFPKFQVVSLLGIVVNYLTCVVFGMCLDRVPVDSLFLLPQFSWFGIAVGLGFLFISIFNLSAISSQSLGIGITSMSMKLGLIVPIMVGIFFYKEPYTWVTLTGIVLALIAVVLSSIQQGSQKISHIGLMVLPLVVFVGSGFCDVGVQVAYNSYLKPSDNALFSISLFLIAFVIGLVVYLVLLLMKKTRFTWQSLIAGIILGIPNYLSIYFIILALGKSGYSSSVIMPVANISVVALSSLVGLFIFKERLSKINTAGIVLAIIAIILLMIKSV